MLRKIDTIKEDQPEGCDNKSEKSLQLAENEYRKLKSGAVAKLEDLKVISDILDRANGWDVHKSQNNDSLKLATYKAIIEMARYGSFEIPEKLIDFNLNKADCLYRQGKINEALDAWENVLKVNPDNQFVHSKILEIMKDSGAGALQAEEVHRKYQFKYLDSFGHHLIKRPYAIVTTDRENTLFVTDCFGDRICIFSISGEYIGSTALGLKNPRDMFKDTEGKVWICDFGNCRLLAVDSDGNKADEIMIMDIVGEEFGSIHPFQGCFNKECFYLLLTDSKLNTRKMISFDMKGRVLLPDMPLSKLQRPSGIKFIGDRLFIGDYLESALFVYDFDQEQFFPFLKGAIPDFLEFLVNINDSIFLSTRKFIVKLSLHAEPVFMVKMDKIFGALNVYPVGLGVLTESNNQILFVSDYSQLCIHRFIV